MSADRRVAAFLTLAAEEIQAAKLLAGLNADIANAEAFITKVREFLASGV